MGKYLSKQDMRLHLADDELVELGLGATDHVNHGTCGDTRARLYITRYDRGFLFFCHNCQARGLLIEDGVLANVRERAFGDSRVTGGTRDKCTGIDNDWYTHDPHHKIPHNDPFVDKVIRYTGWEEYGPYHRWSGGKIFLAGYSGYIFSSGGTEQTGYQGWDRDDKEKLRKTSSGKIQPTLYYDLEAEERDDLLVIVEDPISALCVTSTGLADALVLFGTNCPSEIATSYALAYDRILVWLDADNTQVLEAERTIARTMGMFNRNIRSMADSAMPLNKVDLRFMDEKLAGKQYPERMPEPKYLQPDILRTLLDRAHLDPALLLQSSVAFAKTVSYSQYSPNPNGDSSP